LRFTGLSWRTEGRAKGQGGLDELNDSLRVPVNHGEVLAHRRRQRLCLILQQHQLDARNDDPEGVVELMGHSRRQRAQRRQLLRLARAAFQGQPLADVGDEGHHAKPLGRRHVAQADLQGEFTPVAPAPGEVEAAAHGAHTRLGHVAGAMARMSVAEPVRQEHLQRVTEQLGLGIPKHLLDLSVGQHDEPVIIDDENTLRRGLEEGPYRLLALP
jgi:hypothetical protein